jgi:RimJ/RimL family protein N-acetyltransferase
MTEVLDRIATERLIGERLTAAHLRDLQRMHDDPRMMATMGGVRSPDQTARYLDTNLSHWETHGFGVWVLRERLTSELAGRAVLRTETFGGRTETGLGYALLPRWWGRGYATEIALALVEIGFSTLECASLAAVTLPENVPSQRVLAKAGFHREGDVVHADLPHYLFRRWPSAAGGPGARR